MVAVPADQEWFRINALPRRVWSLESERAAAAYWTERLLNDRGRALRSAGHLSTPQLELELKPVQGVLLSEFAQCRGVYGGIPVGGGKTLATWLFAVIAADLWGIQSSVLCLPASLVEQTQVAFRRFAQVWRSPPTWPTIITYQLLGQDHNAYRLCTCPKCLKDPTAVQTEPGLRPRLLMLDEASWSRNLRAAVTKRFSRYISRHPDTVVVALTASPRRNSVKPLFRHLLWTLKTSAPVPIAYQSTELWAGAVDAKIQGPRTDPGALLHWAKAHTLTGVREGLRERMAQTAGVVIRDESSCDQPLTIRLLECPPDPILDQAFAQFRETDATLDGWALGDVFSVLRHGTELGCGFYYRWDPRPPQAWVDAKQAWQRFVTATIRESQRTRAPLDTEKQVRARHPDAREWLEWRAVRKTFEPNTVAVAVSMTPLAAAAGWLQSPDPGLVWVQHTWVGETLSRLTGVPYYGAEGKDAAGRSVLTHGLRGGPAIVSAHANRYGRNLQGFRRNLIVGPEHSGERLDQMIGRTHRFGQDRPVEVGVMICCAENLVAVAAACAEAQFGREIDGIVQKQLIAQWEWHLGTHCTECGEPRWTPRGGTERLVGLRSAVNQ